MPVFSRGCVMMEALTLCFRKPQGREQQENFQDICQILTHSIHTLFPTRVLLVTYLFYQYFNEPRWHSIVTFF